MYIALCGPSKAGKTTVQQILSEEFGVIPVDDGRVLRDMGKLVFGLTEYDVTTHEGKAKKVEILDREWEVKEILGELGKAIEDNFHEFIVPYVTIKNHCDDDSNYSFGSVRRNQPIFFKNLGGFVLEILREGTEVKYDFDSYDTDSVDVTIANNGTIAELKEKVVRVFGPILGAGTANV